MNSSSQNTKERILLAATKQFAKKGFKGASIRDIAKEADVNLAAVNYHYTNKQTLYWETFVRAYTWIDQTISSIEQTESVEHFSLAIFAHLIQHADYLSNTFITMLSNDTPAPQGEHLKFCQDKKMTPPGGLKLTRIIKFHVGESVSNEKITWAVRNIFSHIFHWAMLTNSAYMKNIDDSSDTEVIKTLKNNLLWHVRATLNFLVINNYT